MKKTVWIVAASLVGLTASLSGCSSSGSAPSASTSSAPANITASALEGEWTFTSSFIRSDGDDTPKKGTYTFKAVGENVFQYTMEITFDQGKSLTWEGLGSVAPNGDLLMSQEGEMVVASGYLADENSIVLQVVELQEVGQDVLPKAEPPTTFAAMETLTRKN